MITRILVFALLAFGATGFIFDLVTESFSYFLNTIVLLLGFVILDFTVNPFEYISNEETDDE